MTEKSQRTEQKNKQKKPRIISICQSAGAVEYTDCFSNAGALRNAEIPFIAIAPRSSLARNGCTW